MKTNAVTDGIFTLISKASCVDIDGDHKCVPAADLKNVAATGNLAALAVPDWATAPVTAMGPDHRRLEGLIAPGSWNVNPPSGTPQDILTSLIKRVPRSTRPTACSTPRPPPI